MTKNILITGAAIRLGRVIVLDLADADGNIALRYHGSAEEAEKTAGEDRAKDWPQYCHPTTSDDFASI
jgi:NAD(P)-dependent dehydrogenase (short-subunit alcohol dehydrogenase family)